MVDRERKLVEKEVGTIDISNYITLQYALEQIVSAINLHGPDATIQSMLYPYSDDNSTYQAIMKKVPETDGEMIERIAREEHYEAGRAERDLAEYKRLQAKFGDKK